jgi:hypothetical protein
MPNSCSGFLPRQNWFFAAVNLGENSALGRSRAPPPLGYHRFSRAIIGLTTAGALLEQVSRYAIEAAFVAERFESAGLSVYRCHDVSCLAQRTSFCCSRRFTSRTGPGERRPNTSRRFLRGAFGPNTVPEPLLLTASWQKPARSRRPAIAMLRGWS